MASLAGKPEDRMKLWKGERLFQIGFAVLVAVLVLAPPFLRSYHKRLLTEILIWGLFALAFDIIYGYTGMLSFGQALFFGVGAYGMAIPILRWDLNLWVALLFAVIASIAFAWPIGYFAVKVSGAYFVIITIIFSLIFFFIALDWRWLTGGDNGLTFTAPSIPLGNWKLSLVDPLTNYYFVLALVLACYLITRRIVASPLGKAFQAIRENEDRARVIGYKVERFKLISYIISGAISGLSGALYAATSRYANVDFLHWTVSGDAVVWTLVGGAGTLIGPMIGSGLLIVFEDYVSSWFKNYPIIVGILVIGVVITAPQGIVGLLRERFGRKER